MNTLFVFSPALRRLLLLTLAATIPSLAFAQSTATTTVIIGRVVVMPDSQRSAGGGAPLPYAAVTVNGKNAQFTDSAGRFQIEGIQPGEITIRAKRIGFTPGEKIFRIARGDTIRFTLQLARLAIQLPPVYSTNMVCKNPGAPGRDSDAGLVDLYEQLKTNAEQFKLLSQTYPYVYAAERQYVTTFKDSVTERTAIETLAGSSVRAWKYEVGKMLVENKATSVTNMHLPNLGDFADENFAKVHCFEYGGLVDLDGTQLIRVDFAPDQKMKEPDVQGSIFLDPKSYQIRRAQIMLSKVPYSLSGELTGHTVTTFFQEIVPGIPIIGAFRAEVFKVREGEVKTELQRVVEVQFLNGKPQP